LHIAIELSSGDNGCVAEPASMFHDASVNLPDVIVGTLGPNWTRPDRQQVEIHSCATNPNGNHPFAKGLARCFADKKSSKDQNQASYCYVALEDRQNCIALSHKMILSTNFKIAHYRCRRVLERRPGQKRRIVWPQTMRKIAMNPSMGVRMNFTQGAAMGTTIFRHRLSTFLQELCRLRVPDVCGP
jgi:hypothetical protein